MDCTTDTTETVILPVYEQFVILTDVETLLINVFVKVFVQL